MRLFVHTFLLVILLATSAQAQPTRPGTDVAASESIYAPVLMQDNSVVLYAIYDATANTIRAYSLWNDSESPVRAHIEFTSGAPIDLIAQPGSRAGAGVVGRGHTITTGIDENIVRFQLWVDHPVVSKDRDRTFPIPRTGGTGR